MPDINAYDAVLPDHKARLEMMDFVEKDFITGLDQVGIYNVNGTFDLLKLKTLKVDQTGYILSWVPRISNEFRSREMLVRSLSMANKPFDGSFLTKQFDDPANSFYLKWAIGNTIASTYVDGVKDWILGKFDSGEYAKENEMLVYALVRYYPYDIAIQYLRKVFPLYPMHSANAMAKIGTKEDLTFLMQALGTCSKEQMSGIKKSIKKMEKRLAKL